MDAQHPVPLAKRELLQAIERTVRATARQTCHEIAVGPFVALLNPVDDAPWFNYAVPIALLDDETTTLTALAVLQDVFRQHQRTLRFEFTAELWPHLSALLERVNLHHESANAQMICTPTTFTPFVAPDVAVRLLALADDLRAYRTLTNRSFGYDHPASEADVDALSSALQQNWRYAVAEINGEWVGVGGYLLMTDATELVAIATHPAWRRRGVAASLTSFLVADYWRNGGTLAFLSAADVAAQAVYIKIGFEHVATRLSYIAAEYSDQ